MFKKIFILIFMLVFLTAGCGKKEKPQDIYRSIINRGKLIVGVQYDAKPFGFIDKDGQLEGVDVDIAKELANRILGSESRVEFKKVSPSTRIEAITSGEVDMVIATMSITPQRKLIVSFSDPYFIAGQAIAVPIDSDIKTYNDLNNKNVIVVLGTTGEKNLRYFAPSAVIQGYKSYSEAFEAFKKGRADAITTDDSLLMGFVMDNKNFKILPKRLTQEPYGIAFKNSEDAASLKVNINRMIQDMQSDGTLNAIKKKWNVA